MREQQFLVLQETSATDGGGGSEATMIVSSSLSVYVCSIKRNQAVLFSTVRSHRPLIDYIF